MALKSACCPEPPQAGEEALPGLPDSSALAFVGEGGDGCEYGDLIAAAVLVAIGVILIELLRQRPPYERASEARASDLFIGSFGGSSIRQFQ